MKTGVGIEDCRALMKLMSSSKSLKRLDISVNDLSPLAVVLIISGLYHNTFLKRLNMSDSHFSLQNSMSLASVLRTNHTLINLSLAHCDIDSKRACQLAIALSTNDTLNVLLITQLGMKGLLLLLKCCSKTSS